MPSPLSEARLGYQPVLPAALINYSQLVAQPASSVPVKEGHEDVAKVFEKTWGQPLLKFVADPDLTHDPLRVGVVFSGGQAPGGHNVICGLYDALKKLHCDSLLFGFLNGPIGILDQEYIEITNSLVAPYRNQGGFDMIASGRTKIDTPEQFAAAEKTARDLDLDGLVVIGGDDSNTNAALLAEYFQKKDCKTTVVGVPKTIDGDLKNASIEISFGFDTATKTFSSIIGDVERDSLSAKKYYFFMKLMGRSASHISLECALRTHPNMALIAEEIAEKKMTLQEVTNQICDMICARADQGKNYGVVLIPEGVIEFIPECKALIRELNALLATGSGLRKQIDATLSHEEKINLLFTRMNDSGQSCFRSLPAFIQSQLLLDRDPHGNVQVSKIETERLFIETVKNELKKREETGAYKGKFSAQPLFCGYEGRSGLPSNFDCNYCYVLGHVAALLIDNKATGYVCCVHGVADPAEHWQIAAAPLAAMIQLEERHGKYKPVIEKALVNLNGKPFEAYSSKREQWAIEDDYQYPGPIQFFGESELVDTVPLSLVCEHKGIGNVV